MRKFYDESFPVGYLEDSDYSTSMREDARLEGIENPDRILAVLSCMYILSQHTIPASYIPSECLYTELAVFY